MPTQQEAQAALIKAYGSEQAANEAAKRVKSGSYSAADTANFASATGMQDAASRGDAAFDNSTLKAVAPAAPVVGKVSNPVPTAPASPAPAQAVNPSITAAPVAPVSPIVSEKPAVPAIPAAPAAPAIPAAPKAPVPSEPSTVVTPGSSPIDAAKASTTANAALATGGLWEPRKDWTPEQNAEVSSLFANGFKNEAQARAQEIQGSVDEKKRAKDEYAKYQADQGNQKDAHSANEAAMDARWASDMLKARTDLKNLESNSVYLAKALGAGQDMTALAAINNGLDQAHANFSALGQEKDAATRTFRANWELSQRQAYSSFKNAVGSEIAEAIKDMDSAQANGYLDNLTGVQDFSKQLSLRLNRINGYTADYANIQNQQNAAAKSQLEFVKNSKQVDGEQSKLQQVYIDKNGNPIVDRDGMPIPFRGDAVGTNYNEETGTFTRFFADRTYETTQVGGSTPGATAAMDADAANMAWNVNNGYMAMSEVPEKMRRAVSTKLYGMANENSVRPEPSMGNVEMASSPLAPGYAMAAPKASAGRKVADWGVVLPESTGPLAEERSRSAYLANSGEKGGQCGFWTNRALNLYGTGAQMGDTLSSKEKACNLPVGAEPSLNSAVVLDTGATTADGKDAGHVGLIVGQDASNYYVKSSNWVGETDAITGNPVGKEEVSVVAVPKGDQRIRGFYDPSYVGSGSEGATSNQSMTSFYEQAMNGKRLSDADNMAVRRAGYAGNAGMAKFQREAKAYRDQVAFPAAAESILSGNTDLKTASERFDGQAKSDFSDYVNKAIEAKYPEKSDRLIASSAKFGQSLDASQELALQKAASTQQAIADSAAALSNMDTGPFMGWLKSKNPWNADAALAAMSSAGLSPLVAKGVFGEVGALTDSDLQRYGKTIPSITNTAVANKAAARYVEALVLKSSMATIENAAKNRRNVSAYAEDYKAMRERYDELRNGMDTVTVTGADGKTETKTPDELQADIHDSLTVNPETGTRKSDVKSVVRSLIKSGVDPLDYSLVPGETDAREKTLAILSNFPFSDDERKAYERIIDRKR